MGMKGNDIKKVYSTVSGWKVGAVILIIAVHVCLLSWVRSSMERRDLNVVCHSIPSGVLSSTLTEWRSVWSLEPALGPVGIPCSAPCLCVMS